MWEIGSFQSPRMFRIDVALKRYVTPVIILFVRAYPTMRLRQCLLNMSSVLTIG